MSKKILKYLGTFLLFILAGGILTAKPCLAASAIIDISSDAKDVTVGDNIFVYVTVKSDAQAGDFEANLTYNDDILEYLSGSPEITGDSGFLKISDIDVTEGTSTRKYTLKFKAATVGTSEIALSGRANVSEYDTGDEMSVSSNVLTLNVKAQKTASDNTYLKSLKISPSGLNPAFDKKVYEYSTNVSYDTDKLIVDAQPEDSKATVSISGNDSLKEGENKIIITVLAESGAVIEYTVNVNKESNPQGETDAADPNSDHNTFTVEQKDGVTYATYQGKYKLVEPGSDVKIPDGYIKGQVFLSGVSVNAYYPENDMGSDFILLYAINGQGEAGFYKYDQIEKTIQRYVPDQSVESEDTTAAANQNEEDKNQTEKYRANLNKAAFIIAVLSVICIILIYVVIRLFMTKKNQHKRSSRKR